MELSIFSSAKSPTQHHNLSAFTNKSDSSVKHFNLVGSCRGFLSPESYELCCLQTVGCCWMAASSYSLVLIIVLYHSYQTFHRHHPHLISYFFIASLKLGSFTSFVASPYITNLKMLLNVESSQLPLLSNLEYSCHLQRNLSFLPSCASQM